MPHLYTNNVYKMLELKVDQFHLEGEELSGRWVQDYATDIRGLQEMGAHLQVQAFMVTIKCPWVLPASGKKGSRKVHQSRRGEYMTSLGSLVHVSWLEMHTCMHMICSFCQLHDLSSNVQIGHSLRKKVTLLISNLVSCFENLRRALDFDLPLVRCHCPWHCQVSGGRKYTIATGVRGLSEVPADFRRE